MFQSTKEHGTENGHNPQLSAALGRAWSLRDHKPDEADFVLKDLQHRFKITEDEARAAIIISRGFAEHPALARAKATKPKASDGYKVSVTSYDAIEAKAAEWADQDRLPRAMLSLLVGSEGLGKTAVAIEMGARYTRGEVEGCFHGTPIHVALLTPEDDPSRTIKPRLMAAGADMTRVHDLRLRKDQYSQGFSLPNDVELIGNAFADHNIGFAIGDPIASLLDPSRNSWKDTDVREALEPLTDVLRTTDTTFLGMLHTNKSNSTDPRQRGIGSVGWRQLARASLLLSVDPDDPTGANGYSRALAHDKHNLGRLTKTRKVALESVPVEIEGRSTDFVRAKIGDECDYFARDLLAAEAGHDDKPADKAEGKAMLWLRHLLDDGPKAVRWIESEAQAAGHSWRTIERAKKEIGVRAQQVKGVKGWTWSLGGGGIDI